MDSQIIVRITSDQEGLKTLGTGFFVSSEGYILSCYHVIGQLNEVFIFRRGDHKSYRANVLHSGEEAVDYALLKVQIVLNDISIPKLDSYCNRDDRVFTNGYQYVNNQIQDYPANGTIIGPTRLKDFDYDFLVLSDCNNIDRGLSGAPAWNRETKAIIGIFTYHIKKTDDAIVIPIDIVLNHLQDKPDSHNLAFLYTNIINIDTFTSVIPEESIIIERQNYLDKIKNLFTIEYDVQVKFKLCILYGEKGIGKSTLAKCASSEFSNNVIWKIDQNSLLSEEEKNSVNSDWLIVFDNINTTHPLIDNAEIRRLKNLSTNILCVTNCFEDAETLASIAGFYNYRQDNIIKVERFTPEECCEFFQRIPNIGVKLTPNYQINIGHCLHGMPLLLQVFRDYVENDYDYNWIYQSSLENELDKFVEEIIQKWVKTKITTPYSRYVIALICFYSFWGISLKSIFFLLRIPGIDIEKTLLPFFDKGLISVFRSKRFPDDIIYVPHNILRDTCSEIEELNSLEVKSYLSEKFNTSDLLNQENPISAFDAWLIGIHDIFSEKYSNDFTGFMNALNNHMSKFPIVRPRNGINGKEFFQTCKIFSQRLENIDSANRLQCDQLIAFAYATNQLPPSLEIGDMIWLGAKHGDPWARSTCIWSAAYHWNNLLNDKANVRKTKINQWFNDFFYGLPADERLTHDFDSAAALGNLCVLGYIDFAIEEITNTLAFRRTKSYTLISDLVIIINIYDKSKTESKYDLILKKYIDDNWNKIVRSTAKDNVLEYIKDKYNFKGRNSVINEPSMELLDFNRNIDVTCTLADASHSMEFIDFTKKHKSCSTWSAYSGNF